MINIVKKFDVIVTEKSENPVFTIQYELSSEPPQAWIKEIENWQPGWQNSACEGVQNKPVFMNFCPKVSIEGKILDLRGVTEDSKVNFETNLKKLIDIVNEWYTKVYEPRKREQEKEAEERKARIESKVEETKRKLME